MKHLVRLFFALCALNHSKAGGFGGNPFPFISILYRGPNLISLMIAETMQDQDHKKQDEQASTIEILLSHNNDIEEDNDIEQGNIHGNRVIDHFTTHQQANDIIPCYRTIFLIKTYEDFKFKVNDKLYKVNMPTENNTKLGFFKAHPLFGIPQDMQTYVSACNLLVNISLPIIEESDKIFEHNISTPTAELPENKTENEVADNVKEEFKRSKINQYTHLATTNEYIHNLFATTAMIYTESFLQVEENKELANLAASIHNLFAKHEMSISSIRDLFTKHKIPYTKVSNGFFYQLPDNNEILLLTDHIKCTKDIQALQFNNDEEDIEHGESNNCNDNSNYSIENLVNCNILFIVTPNSIINFLLEEFDKKNNNILNKDFYLKRFKEKNKKIYDKAENLIEFALNETNHNNVIFFDWDSNNTATYQIGYQNNSRYFFALHSISLNSNANERLNTIDLHSFEEYEVTISDLRSSHSFYIKKLNATGNDNDSALHVFSSKENAIRIYAKFEEKKDGHNIALNFNPEIQSHHIVLWDSVRNISRQIMSNIWSVIRSYF